MKRIEKRERFNALSMNERVKFFATGRPSVARITQVVNGVLTDCYVGKVRGTVTTKNGEYRWQTSEDAGACAREFVARAKKQLAKSTAS